MLPWQQQGRLQFGGLGVGQDKSVTSARWQVGSCLLVKQVRTLAGPFDQVT